MKESMKPHVNPMEKRVRSGPHRTQPFPMAHPEKEGTRVSQSEELQLPPEGQSTGVLRRQTIPMEGHVPSFIPQDEVAHVGDGFVVAVPTDQLVVGRAHDFHQQEHLHLRLSAQDTSTLIEETKRKTVSHKRSPESDYGPSKQAGVLRLFGKPEINHLFDLHVSGAQVFRI
jgi:hypothetical protein